MTDNPSHMIGVAMCKKDFVASNGGIAADAHVDGHLVILNENRGVLAAHAQSVYIEPAIIVFHFSLQDLCCLKTSLKDNP